MTKSEWDAMNSMDRDKEVAWRLMGWSKPEKSPDWKNDRQEYVYDDGEPVGYRSKDTGELTPFDAILWHNPSGRVSGTCRIPKYTTDRNACALVLDKIDARNLRVEFEDALSDESDDPAVFIDARYAIEWAMRLSPDFICYCAVKAVEDAR